MTKKKERNKKKSFTRGLKITGITNKKMKTKEIHKLAVKMGMRADFRGKEGVKEVLKRRKEKYDKLSSKKKKEYDKSDLHNPYFDSRVLHISRDGEIKKVMVGIDIGPGELLMADKLGDIDLVISHHPLGKGLARLSEVMSLQADVLASYGVPINIGEALIKERMSEVARGVNAANHQRTVDAAKILGINLMCLHTVCDNLAANFLKKKVEKEKPKRLKDLLELLKNIPEYEKAKEIGAGPKAFVGSPERRCGKIALTEITGGTEGSPKIYEKMAQAGIGTVVGMHIGKEHYEEAKKALLNVVIAGHMSSDSLGVNLFADQLEKGGVKVVPCSGFTRVSRV